MKKVLCLTIISIFLINISAHAFVEKRYEWWKIRLINLEREKSNIDVNNNNSLLKELINYEIEDSHKILNVFEKFERGIENLSEEEKTFSKQEIKDEVVKHVEPVFSVYLLYYTLSNIGNKKWNNISKQLIKQKLKKIFDSKFHYTDRNYLQLLYKREFDKIENKYISKEIFLSSIMSQQKKLLNSCVETISESVMKNTKIISKPVVYSTLLKIIDKNIQTYFKEINFDKMLTKNQLVIEDCWVWQKNYQSIKKNIKNYLQIKKFLKFTREPKDVASLEYYFNRPLKLEKIAFKTYYKKYCNTKKFIRNKRDKNSEINLQIPGDPDLVSLFVEIDELRKKYMNEVSGQETKTYFVEKDKTLRNLIIKKLAVTGKLFKIEENKLKEFLKNTPSKNLEEDEKENQKEDIIITDNIKEQYHNFYYSKNLYFTKLKHANIYRKQTINFLKWFSSSKKIDNKALYNNHNYMLKRNKNYIQFIALLENNAAKSTTINFADLKVKYISLKKFEDHFFKSIRYCLSFNNIRKFLNKDKILELNENNKYFLEYINASNREIKNLRKNYFVKLKQSNRQKKNRLLSIKGKIAQYELDLLNKSVKEYYKNYKEISYAESVFLKYSMIFNALYDEASSGIFSEKFDIAIKTKSVFPLINNFNGKKLVKNYKTKEYLRKIIRLNISRIKALSDFYKRQRVEILNKPDFNNFQNIKNIIYKQPEIKISAWKMNERNFITIDRNLVQYLIKIRKRKIWENSITKGTNLENPDNKYFVSEINYKMHVPDGWEKAKPKKLEKAKGIVTKFVNFENNTLFSVVKIPLNGLSKEEVTDNWVKRNGQRTIKVGWGKENKKDFYWNLSAGNKNKKLFKNYAFKKDNNLIIIRGESPKKYYPYFKNRIEALFSSVR